MMIDEPPPPPVSPHEQVEAVEPHLPTETRADGSIAIDLISLAPPPKQCAEEEPEPDPFNPEIVVCGETELSARLGADYGPTADEVIEGSAVPRAKWQLSDNASAELNGTQTGVGGFSAQGGEVRVKIDF
ncbi:hypothetical protein [Erythrobacter rubeus]|uniref:Uncharacterized protein n=1 Tax=Erythrobacter rubeus TaxID=2760803 RepID=A0ABR8KSL2_9SPHN|nr:hypothetical protein [Erythrobacter rubeus]MBD2842233.1 hypothetical protein [Erythrobacter rubeus]